MKLSTIVLAFAGLALASVANAQQTHLQEAASFPPALTNVAPSNGSYLAQFPVVRGPWDSFAPIPNIEATLGVEWAWGNVWVSARGIGGAGNHLIAQFTPNGALINTMVQQNTGATLWGIRDLESDEANNKLWGGQEGNQLHEYDRVAGAPDTLVFNHVDTITGAPGGIIRALCRDNAGVFYTANFNSVILRFTINPVAIGASTTGPGKAIYGMGYDRINDTLWAFSQDNLLITPPAPAGGDLVEINEIDKNTGALTGAGGWGQTYGIANDNIAGGLDIYENEVNNPGKLTLLALHQENTFNEVFGYDLGKFTQPQPDIYCTAKVNSQGCSPSVGYSGQSSATAASGFTLTASLELNNKVGLVLYSEFGRDAAPFGPGGILCVKAPTRRSKGFNSGGTPPPTADCSGVFSIDFNTFARGLLGAPPNPAAYLSLPGQVVTAQFWGRDPGIAVPNNFSLSNGIEFDVGP